MAGRDGPSQPIASMAFAGARGVAVRAAPRREDEAGGEGEAERRRGGGRAAASRKPGASSWRALVFRWGPAGRGRRGRAAARSSPRRPCGCAPFPTGPRRTLAGGSLLGTPHPRDRLGHDGVSSSCRAASAKSAPPPARPLCSGEPHASAAGPAAALAVLPSTLPRPPFPPLLRPRSQVPQRAR